MRLQLALNVRDLDEAVAFYSALFDARPHKRRAHYANFALTSPPLKLVLFEDPQADERINHLGVEVMDANTLAAAHERLQAAGLVETIERDETCCYATQDKAWTQEPQGLRWEWYRITDDAPADEAMTCCDTDCCPDVVAAVAEHESP